jgi:hypothetical protein
MLSPPGISEILVFPAAFEAVQMTGENRFLTAKAGSE